MENEINDIDNLIGKVLAKEASAEEQRQLEQWLQISEANRKYLEQIVFVFEKSAGAQVQTSFDTDVAWRKVKEQLNEARGEKSSSLQTSTLSLSWRIAAGVVILMGAMFFTYQWLNQPTQTFAAVTDHTTAQDTLPDGSTAFLNKKSSVSYEYNPRKKIRRVKLKGEGFFEVKHVEEKPFVIEAEDVLIRDIGTSFNVKAYPESDTIMVTVKTGEVQVYTVNNEGLRLKMGETGIYSKRLREFTRLELADTNVLAYKTGILSFHNTYLKSVIEKINDLYDAKIKLENPELGSCRLTVNFQGDKLDTIVEVIAETLNLTVTRRKKEILLNGPGCN